MYSIYRNERSGVVIARNFYRLLEAATVSIRTMSFLDSASSKDFEGTSTLLKPVIQTAYMYTTTSSYEYPT